MRSWVRLLLKGLVLAIIALIVAGIVYEQLGERSERKRFPQIGRSVDIGGRTLNLYCSGEGSPTVILDGAIGYGWAPIQREIAKITHVCWYDRAGHGWSDPGPSPRTSAAMALDLHELLRAAAVPPPYVLVGASFGGFPVRVFAGKYSNEVAGVVLVDSSHEDQHEPPSMQAPVNRLPRPVHGALCTLLPMAGRVGLLRLMLGSYGSMRDPPQGMSTDDARYFYFLSDLPKSFVASGNEACNWEASANEARAAGNLGDRPLIVLTGGKEFVPDDPAAAKEALAFHEVWVHELQPQLARLSTRGKQVIVKDSGHSIAPDAVIGAITEVIEELHGKSGGKYSNRVPQ
jgi:pimeloyl-ACP methyl ester carboxylesterase